MQPEARLLFRESGVPIRNLLEPADERVVVEWEPEPVRGYIPSFIPARELLAGNARIAGTVAVARIESRTSALTPDGTWIASQR